MSRQLSDEPNEPGAVGYFDKIVGVNDNKGFFAVCKMIVVPPKDVIEGEDDRCDRGTYGPSGLHRWDETANQCSCGSTEQPNEITGDHVIVLEDLLAYYPILEAIPHGFVVYIELKDAALEEEAIRWPHHTRTLQEMLRYIIEWSWAHDALGNREEIAVICKGIVDTLSVPSFVEEWVLADVPPEKVGRYLQGHPDARARTTEPIPELPADVSAWIHELIINCRTFGEYEKERAV